MAHGDLLFYGAHHAPSAISTAEDLEGDASGSWATHVAVMLGGTTALPLVVEAVPPRVVVQMHPDPDLRLVPWRGRYPQPRRDRALAWLQEQTNRHYSWADIISNALRILHLDFGVFDRDAFDCSHLVFSYMTLAGEDWFSGIHVLPESADWVADPQLVTPAKLWRYTQAILHAP